MFIISKHRHYSIMKISIENFNDHLSYGKMVFDYLNTMTIGIKAFDFNDINVFIKLMKMGMEEIDIRINNIKMDELWWLNYNSLIDSLINLEQNGIISLHSGGIINIPDNIPLELTLS